MKLLRVATTTGQLLLATTTFLAFLTPILAQNNNETQPIYTVTGSGRFRPNSDYHISIQLAENATSPATFSVSVSGPSTSGQFNQASTSVTVNPGENRITNLEIGEWSKGNYKLIVDGRSSELNVSNEASLTFEPKTHSIFVQSDKAIYKPGQTVKFRALILNPSLIPSVSGTIDIFIKDPKDNLIKQWKRVFPQKGVVSEEFALSAQPPLGDWSIVVDVQGQQFKKQFTVAEYVLPTFSVDIQLPPYATYNRSDVVATVKAQYTYGKPVKGLVTLTVQPRIRYSGISFRPLEQHTLKMKLSEEGTVDIPVNIVRDLNLKTDFFEREIEFFALVEEGLTGRKYNKSSVLKIFHKEIKVELIKTSNTFKPGLRYTAFLKVAYQDDKPVDDDGKALTLRYGYAYNDANWTNVLELVPKAGIIRVDLFPPKSTVDQRIFIIGWRAEYRGQSYYLDSVECAQSPSNTYLQVTSGKDDQDVASLFDSKAISVGQETSFKINITEPVKILTYQVVAKGDLVLARSVRATEVHGSNLFNIDVPITHQMTPKARLLVYYVREENQEIVADSLNFNVGGVFKTPVTVSSSVNQTKPGSNVEIRVQTKPSAFVGLLGVDQSVLLLKSGNDLTQEDVLKELESYDGGRIRHENSNWGFRSPWFWSGATTASEIFDDSGVVLLTNGYVHREHHTRIGKRIFYSARSEGVLVSGQEKPVPKRAKSASIRLDDFILEEGLQTPTFKVKGPKEARIVLRKEFPETWIWSNITAGFNGDALYSDKIPDTITSWFVSAFAVDSISGLGVAESPAKIAVFRPFFIKLSLPYSIIRGESVSLPVVIFNYQNKPIQAEVVMKNEKEEFEFTNAANEIEFAGETNVKEKKKTVTIPPYDGVSVEFVVTPKKLGHIDIKVEARTGNAGDAVVRKLLVKPEGQTQYFNKATFVSLGQETSKLEKNISIEIPSNAIPGSVHVKVSGISDILGPTVNHIDDLLRMPYGCGEQNMINLVPNIVVLNYLNLAKRLNDGIKSKAVNHIETGYQKELTYRRDDGSFSAFGQSDKSGSTWLTAFVVKSFIQARPYIAVDSNIVNKSIEFLFSRQRKDGSFAEYGEVHNKALQGGAALKIGSKVREDNQTDSSAGPLTAYVLIAILHESKSDPIRSKNEFAIKRAVDYCYAKLEESNNPYEIAVITYALHLADSVHKEKAYQKLMTLNKQNADGYMYWSNEAKKTNTSDRLKIVSVSEYLSLPQSLDVESSAYGLLTLVLRGDIDNALPVLRWLISKQNSNGGFSSTQDTVIGLQALGAIAERITSGTLKMNVDIKHGTKQSMESGIEDSAHTLDFTPETALVLQQIELPSETLWVDLKASGFGSAILQVSYQYNLAVSAEKPSFYLSPQKDKTSTDNYLQLSVCTYYKDGNSTNMAVLEVELPSGYSADVDALPAATRAKDVKRVDTANHDGTVFIYLDRVTRDELCVTVPAHRTHRVANNKPVPVTIYDYYDRSKQARIFYEPTLVTFCDICPKTEPECKQRCAAAERRTSGAREARGEREFDFSDRLEEEDYNDPNHSFSLQPTSFILCVALILASFVRLF